MEGREAGGVEMEGERGQTQKILGGLASNAVDHGQPLSNNLGICALWYGDFASSVCSRSIWPCVLQIAGLEVTF